MKYQLKLFVSGEGGYAKKVKENLTRICDRWLADNYTLDVVDVAEDPRAADEAKVVATPTMLRLQPTPRRRLIGDMTDEMAVLAGLDIDSNTPER